MEGNEDNGDRETDHIETKKCNEEELEEKDILTEVSKVYEELMSGAKGVEDACQAECVIVMQERIKKVKCGLESIKTAQLWLEYMEMVAILKRVMKTKRFGDGKHTWSP